MIKIVREVTTKLLNAENDSHVPASSMIILAVTTDSEHYDKIEELVESLGVEIEEKVSHEG
jgi:hypothetical protein